MKSTNRTRDLAFSDDRVTARLIEDADGVTVTGVAVNLSHRPMVIGGEVDTVIPPWKSTTLRDGIIVSGERVVILDVPTKTNLGGIPFGAWDWFGDRFAKFPRTTPLYISRYDIIGEVTADPFVFSNTRAAGEGGPLDRYDVRLNLWWAPAETDCFIHNEHPFLEIHTQIYGSGRIQMFKDRDETSLYREITMAAGYTHDPFVQVTGQRAWLYPWHRYYSDTDAIWLAIELHPKD